MRNGWYTGRAIGFGVALTLVGGVEAQAQARSDRVIPVRKEGTVQRESRGEVIVSADRARIDALEAMALTYQRRIDSISAATGALSSRTADAERMISALQDSLRMVRGEMTTVHSELAAANARVSVLGDSLYRLNRSYSNFKNGSIFGNSGLYIGVGTGANITTGTLENIGYKEGLNIVVPIGWQKRGIPVGFRAEIGVQTFDGRTTSSFANNDPELYTASGMLTLHLPMNQAKTNNFYLMGGGGAYMFRDVGANSALGNKLDANTFNSSSNTVLTKGVTKLGVTAGAGLEFHILGASSFFVQSAFTNVFAEAGTNPGMDTGKNLRWIPIVAGIQLR